MGCCGRSSEPGGQHGQEAGVSGSQCCGTRAPVRGLVTVTCCVVFQLTLGFTYTSANLMPYLTSYLRNVTGESEVDYSQTLWVDQSGFILSSLATPCLGVVEKRMSNRLFIAIGWLFYTASFVGNYWAVQRSFLATVMVYGVLQGVAIAVIFPAAVKLSLSWFPHSMGLVSGVVMAGFGGGAFIWNQIVTNWINPDNLQPDEEIGENLYFTQLEVLQRVPSCYLVMGGLLGGLQLICLLAISSPPALPPVLDTTVTISTETEAGEEKRKEDEKGGEEGERDLSGGLVSGNGVTGGQRNEQGNSASYVGFDNDAFEHSPEDPERRAAEAIQREDDEGEADKMTSWDIITSRAAWTIFIFSFVMDLGFSFVKLFFKAYGQTFIRNDHLLSLVASVAAVFNALGRPMWGWVADRLGMLPTFLTSLAVLSCLVSTFMLCEAVGGAAMFFVWMCLMYLGVSGIYNLTNPIVYTLFGPSNFFFAIGFVYLGGAILAPSVVYISSTMQGAFGWHGLFLFSAVCVFLSLLVMSSLLLDCGHPLTSRMKRALLDRRHQSRGPLLRHGKVGVNKSHTVN
ncbi:hypothetical protein V1264_019578 [Littorina saxatilis]|uniref:Major facilitator superfamily (MFS) profile domain-containing protein n=1 Tax=Littorina saxatilis TaxID=31220 RepID=A0AAN9GE58_9CAEN